jgi:cysteine synthase A
MSPFDCPRRVEDAKVRARVVATLKERRVRLPTFAELADPALGPFSSAAALAGVSPDAPDAANLARVNWFNDWDRRGRRAAPAYLEIPPELSGVRARIVVAVGDLFPMIGAHKVLAAYACLAPRLAAGRFDPSRQRAVWPSTGNYCRGGVAIARILGCRGVAVLPAGMSQERFDWLGQWVSAAEDVVRTPGSESNVKEIYDKCAELARDPANDIINQFSEFANYLVHWRCTGPALDRIFEAVRAGAEAATLAGFVAASGSAGTLAAGDYLKERYGTKIAVVEAVECPTLALNGYGEHNIQGIGDKHVPLIHNVTNTDLVIGVSDRATDGLHAVFNTAGGRAHLTRRLGLALGFSQAFGHFGLSSIANILGAIKMAKHLALGPDQVIVTVATDGGAMYGSELNRFLARRAGGDTLSETLAAELTGQYLIAACSEHVLEASTRERQRMFNLGYFTWVEQQGIAVADFDRRRQQGFWRDLRGLLPLWDEMISAVNRDSGMVAAA